MINTPSKTQKESRTSLLTNHVRSKVSTLQHGITQQHSPAAGAAAAKLRRGVTRLPGSVPEIWEHTLGGLPECLVGRGDAPSDAETAAHLAVCLYALHQQSQSGPMHVTGVGLGTAVRRMIAANGGDLSTSPTVRRFDALSTSTSSRELHVHLRHLITQLRSAGIGLDYARLAADLYRFAHPPFRDSVRLGWGRGFYGYQPAQGHPTDSPT